MSNEQQKADPLGGIIPQERVTGDILNAALVAETLKGSCVIGVQS